MEITTKGALRRIKDLQRELEYLKRDLLQVKTKAREKPSLFGSVRGGDITDEMIEEAKKDLFREPENL
jgi:ribosomal protein L9